MIRGVKGMLALVALAALGLALRWMTAGSIGAANSHDLDSLTVLAVGTVAWIAYGWIVLAVVSTVLEQLPGTVGAIASAISGRITSQTSRTLLRSALGVAAVTPLTVAAAHAAPADHAVSRPWARTDPALPTTPYSSTWRTTEPPSSVRLTGPALATGTHRPQDVATRPQDAPRTPAQNVHVSRPQDVPPTPAQDVPVSQPQDAVQATSQRSIPRSHTETISGTPESTDWRTTEPPSSVRLTEPASNSSSLSGQTSSGTPGTTNRPTTEPRSTVRLAGPTPTTSHRAGEVAGTPQQEAPRTRPQNTTTTHPTSAEPSGGPADAGRRAEAPTGGRVRVGVPDRPTAGAATRYTDLTSGQPGRVPARVVVKPGDTLWSIAATELGPNATPEAIAARWPAWYAANRELIGADPDLIRPGQVLRIPAAATGKPVPPTHQEK